jgi:ribonuclease H / adenosylcobalamin/alpha-ribazole phosphatase
MRSASASSAAAAKTLLLVRHGESERNAEAGERERDSDSPLSARGRGQASGLARWMTQQFASRAISLRTSPALRCVETAEIVANRLGLSRVIDEDLREPPERAPTLVADADEARAMLDAIASGQRSTATPRAESHAELVARLRAVLERALAEEAPVVVLVSHFVTLNILLRVLVEPASPRAGLWVRLDNASVTRVEIDASGGVMLGYVNRVE